MRNFFDFYLYVFKFHKIKYIVSIINILFFIFAIYEFVRNFNSRISLALLLFSTLKLSYDFSLLIRDYTLNRIKNYSIRQIKFPNLIPEKDYLIKKYNNVYGIDTISYSININKYLLSSNKKRLGIIRDYNKEKVVQDFIYDNFEKLKYFLFYLYKKSQAQKKDFFNEKKLCLSRDISLNEPIYCHKGCYYDSAITNYILGKFIIDSKGNIIANYQNFLPYDDENKIIGISANSFNNNIGVSSIGFTKDNYLIVWIQNSRAQNSNNLLVPTGSGSCDWKDIVENDFIKTIKYSMNRELLEESFSMKYNKKMIEKTMIIGFFKWINKGGKPEFVGLSKINSYLVDLKTNYNEVRASNRLIENTINYHKFNNIYELEDILKKILKGEIVSTPLKYCIEILLENIKSDPVNIKTFLKI